ncbi:hypothetical protein BD289DRAFT_138558 [Coniella lustricola]|uniref:Uncharacterized protein n=1 Tax=Coniella lustricola TaxID=2025994 RepID=A0A2T2ZVI0_9PEZI|nr:hypothetical protein BD289DRAFT_138558 [Coniella lustricola]
MAPRPILISKQQMRPEMKVRLPFQSASICLLWVWQDPAYNIVSSRNSQDQDDLVINQNANLGWLRRMLRPSIVPHPLPTVTWSQYAHLKFGERIPSDQGMYIQQKCLGCAISNQGCQLPMWLELRHPETPGRMPTCQRQTATALSEAAPGSPIRVVPPSALRLAPWLAYPLYLPVLQHNLSGLIACSLAPLVHRYWPRDQMAARSECDPLFKFLKATFSLVPKWKPARPSLGQWLACRIKAYIESQNPPAKQRHPKETIPTPDPRPRPRALNGPKGSTEPGYSER